MSRQETISECILLRKGFPGSSGVKNLPANGISGSGRSPGGGNGNPLQYICLENPMDRVAWRDTVSGYSQWVCRVRHDLATEHITHKGPERPLAIAEV